MTMGGDVWKKSIPSLLLVVLWVSQRPSNWLPWLSKRLRKVVSGFRSSTFVTMMVEQRVNDSEREERKGYLL